MSLSTSLTTLHTFFIVSIFLLLFSFFLTITLIHLGHFFSPQAFKKKKIGFIWFGNNWFSPFKSQALAAARIKGGYPERIGQPECQVCITYLLCCSMLDNVCVFMSFISDSKSFVIEWLLLTPLSVAALAEWLCLTLHYHFEIFKVWPMIHQNSHFFLGCSYMIYFLDTC